MHQFETEPIFWKQFVVGQKLVELRDRTVLQRLEPMLEAEDRHVRGNAAFVFASLGDDRGFEEIRGMLQDRSSYRSEGQGSGANWNVRTQIRDDRFYAAHLLGELKDARALPVLIPLLHDPDVNWKVAWALGQIGDKVAILPLIQALSDPSPDMRVIAIDALDQLDAKEALPQLHLMLHDEERIHFDDERTVAQAAKIAITKMQPPS